MCRNFPKLLMAPAEAILAAKKKASYGDALGTLIIDGIVLAVAVAIAIVQFSNLTGLSVLTSQGLGMAAIITFVATFLGGLFFALMTKLVVNTIGGKGSYLHGLTTIAYTMAAPAIAALIASICFTVQYIGLLVVFIAVSLGCALGIATLYRSVKELFSTDLIAALVSVGVLMTTLAVVLALIAPLLGVNIPGLTALA